jgi:hypothetical protein
MARGVIVSPTRYERDADIHTGIHVASPERAAAFHDRPELHRLPDDLPAARVEGRLGGRRKKLDDTKRREIAEAVISDRKTAARMFGVLPPTASGIVAAHVVARLSSMSAMYWLALAPQAAQGMARTLVANGRDIYTSMSVQ